MVTFVSNLLVVGGKSQEQPGVDGGSPGNLGLRGTCPWGLGAPPLKGKGDQKLKTESGGGCRKDFRGGQRRFPSFFLFFFFNSFGCVETSWLCSGFV